KNDSGRQASGRTRAVDTNRLDERAAIRAQCRAELVYGHAAKSRHGLAVVQVVRIGVLLAATGGYDDTGIPRLEHVDVSRADRTTRMEATRFAAVFDVDADDGVGRRLLVAIRGIRRR